MLDLLQLQFQGLSWDRKGPPHPGMGFLFIYFYLCRSICLCAAAGFFAVSCCFGALALPASKLPGLSWLTAALFLPLTGGLFVSSFFAVVPWGSGLGGRPLLVFAASDGPVSSTFFSSGFWWIFSVPDADAVLFFPRSVLFPCVAWSELIS